MRAQYYGDAALAGLRSQGHVVLHESAEPLAAEALIAAARGCELIVADRNTPVDAGVIAGLADVAAILRVAVDVRNIDVAAASTKGILVTQASRSWVAAVSELAIGLMIDAARGMSRADAAYKAGRGPAVAMGRQLGGATAGIIGYGPLGKRVAELCLAFGMTVLVYDPYVKGVDPSVRQTSLDDLCAQADYVLPLAVATAETENLIGAKELAAMRSTAYLINLSRGNLIDEAALIAALDARQIAGAAMDVGRAADQMPSVDLATRADVIATPHIGGLTKPAIEGQALETVTQVRDILAGQMPIGAVNAAAATRLPRFNR
jgi:D-3-phosphoglycerate dehydrogenase